MLNPFSSVGSLRIKKNKKKNRKKKNEMNKKEVKSSAPFSASYKHDLLSGIPQIILGATNAIERVSERVR